MKTLSRLLLVTLLACGLNTGWAQAKTAPGYQVLVEITFDEKGAAEDGKVVQSDDPTGARLLDSIAVAMAAQVKQEPRLENGKPVKFKARAPFNFPVEGDEGAAANEAPKPALHSIVQPAYPEALAAAKTPGGAIVELLINADGSVKTVKVLRASHPEFAQAVEAALPKWVFTPAKKDGVAVESRWRIAVSFTVDGGKEPDWTWRVAPRPSLGTHTVVRSTRQIATTLDQAAPPAAPVSEEKK